MLALVDETYLNVGFVFWSLNTGLISLSVPCKFQVSISHNSLMSLAISI